MGIDSHILNEYDLGLESILSVSRMKGFLVLYLSILAACSADQIKLKYHPSYDDPEIKLIWFNRSTFNQWSEQLDNYLEIYRTPELTEGRSNNIVDCNYNNPPHDKAVCGVNVNSFRPCVAANYFGYQLGTPCVFIEIEKILDWKPKYYNSTTSLPKHMPKKLKDKIEELTVDPQMWETLWISCDGESPADMENIGPIQYIPKPGFPGFYFPFNHQPGYLSPLVALFFELPKRGIVISVECKAWAPGILQSSKKELGVVKFELLIDV